MQKQTRPEVPALSNRVLVLSADGQAVDSIVAPLQRNGHSVMVTHDLNTALSQINEQHLVVLDAQDDSTLAMLCRRITDETGSRHPPILAVAQTQDVDTRVHLLEAGADDVVAMPIDERELEAMSEALMLRAPEPVSPSEDSSAAPPRPAQTAPGRVIVFAAAKGGSGTTTLAVNTAVVLAESAPASVSIADMDMAHGQISTHLDIYARVSTAQLAGEDRAAQTPDTIHESGKQHSSGLMVFGGPYRPDEGSGLNGEQLASLVDVFRATYATTIVDVGSTPDMRSLYVLARADHIVVPIAPDIPSLRLVHAWLQVMSEFGGMNDKTFFALNEIYPRSMITAAQIESHLGIKVSATVPYEGEAMARAVNEGHPLVTLVRRGPAALAIKQMAETITETKLEERVVATPARKQSLFGSFLRRS
ncbi:MAG TPA: division plane positioning ATPase MipZ [Candidatus Limnocylindrales bacterium]